MTKEEALKKLQAIKAYMTSGNPIWSVEPVGEAFDMAIKALEQSQWIPCGERLPETDDKVLCQTVTKKGQINYVIGYYSFERWCCGMNSNVIAWMPLPEPYKGGE